MTARLTPEREAEIRSMIWRCEKSDTGEPWTSTARALTDEIDALRADLRAANATIAIHQAQAALDRAEIDRLRDTLTGLASDLSNVRG